MLRAMTLIVASIAAGAAAMASQGHNPLPNPNAPVVVELFESQGCSSCPPANANVNALSTRSDLLTLMYGVTYWDQLGWTDTFARPEFTERQRDYMRGLGNDNVYTPQVVLNGRTDLVGNNRRQLDVAIRHAANTAFSATGSIRANRVEITALRPSRAAADVWLVRYDPRTVNVAIRAGENDGRTLPHSHVVREIRRLGAWDGASRTYDLPPPTQVGLRTAVLIQEPNGGPIVGVVSDVVR